MKTKTHDNSMTGKLLILGDSISLGVAEVRGNDVVGRVERCYVDQLRQAMPRLQIIVDADVHRTISAARLMVQSLVANHKPDVVLVMLGGNDADLDWRRFVLSDGKVARSRVPVDTYAKNLRLVATDILAAGATPVLTDMPNHHFELRGPYVSALAGKDVTAMLERGGGQNASDRELVKYRAAVAQVAEDLQLLIASYGPILDAQRPQDMVGVDGVHPSNAAHALIAVAMLDPIRQAFARHANRMTALSSIGA